MTHQRRTWVVRRQGAGLQGCVLALLPRTLLLGLLAAQQVLLLLMLLLPLPALAVWPRIWCPGVLCHRGHPFHLRGSPHFMGCEGPHWRRQWQGGGVGRWRPATNRAAADSGLGASAVCEHARRWEARSHSGCRGQRTSVVSGEQVLKAVGDRCHSRRLSFVKWALSPATPCAVQNLSCQHRVGTQ